MKPLLHGQRMSNRYNFSIDRSLLHGSWSVKLGMPSVNWPELRIPRLGLGPVISPGGWLELQQQSRVGLQYQPTQRAASEYNQDQNGQENANSQNWPQTQSHQQH